MLLSHRGLEPHTRHPGHSHCRHQRARLYHNQQCSPQHSSLARLLRAHEGPPQSKHHMLCLQLATPTTDLRLRIKSPEGRPMLMLRRVAQHQSRGGRRHGVMKQVCVALTSSDLKLFMCIIGSLLEDVSRVLRAQMRARARKAAMDAQDSPCSSTSSLSSIELFPASTPPLMPVSDMADASDKGESSRGAAAAS